MVSMRLQFVVWYIELYFILICEENKLIFNFFFRLKQKQCNESMCMPCFEAMCDETHDTAPLDVTVCDNDEVFCFFFVFFSLLVSKLFFFFSLQ